MPITDNSSPSELFIHGRWLLLARILWGGLFVVSAGMLALAANSLYTGWGEWAVACPAAPADLRAACIANQQALQQLGLPLRFPAVFFSSGVIFEVLPWLLVGLLIFWRQSHRPFGFFFSLMMVISGVFILDSGIPEMLYVDYAALRPLLAMMGFLGSVLLIVWYRFPDGRFFRGEMRWAAALWVALQLGSVLGLDSALNFENWPDPLPIAVNPAFAASLVFAFLDRYRRLSTPLQRQQIKWVLVSLSSGVLAYVFRYVPYFMPGIYSPGLPQVLWWLIYTPLFYLTGVMIAVSISVSILRYRLWDLDFVINRSLVYGALTALLAVIFGGSLFLVSRLVEGQALVIAFGVTALSAGMLFNPARRRLQRFVDQRFYNIQIDYQKTPPPVPAAGGITQVLQQTQFGAYQNLQLIGRGGMAEVYKSTHPTLGVPVAIKILPAYLAAEAEFRQRFRREAQIVARLEHPHIVRVFDSGEQDDMHYMVMEFLNGKGLDEWIKTSGSLPLALVLQIVSQIAAALDYAHAQGVVHRDIKPSNIMLEGAAPDGPRAVLTDFGIARMLNAHTVMTRTGGMLGTLDYIAPEQIQESAKVDGRADLYALGVMVYQMLTGELPFKHNNPGALLIAHLTQPPPDPHNLLPDLPLPAASAVQRSLAKKPGQRFATATEFALAMMG